MTDEPKRWICWPTPDEVCVQGGCGYCDPYSCACGKRHPGSRKVSRLTVERLNRELDLGVSGYWIDNGMRTKRVEERAR